MALALPVWALLALGSTRYRSGARRTPTRLGGAGPAVLRPALLLAGLFFAADLSLWHISILRTSVANATLLANLAPVFVAAGSFFLFGERFGRLHLAALALSLAGVSLLLRSSTAGPAGDLVGDLFGVATAVAYAGYFLAIGRVRQRLSTAVVMSGVSLSAAPLLLGVALFEAGPVWPSAWTKMGPVVALALVAQCIGQGAVAFGLARLPPSFGSVVLLLQPVVAALLAWPLFGEVPGGMQAVGAAAVLVGIGLARRATEKR